MTAASLEDTLRQAHEFINDEQHGLTVYIQRIKNRSTATAMASAQ